MLDFLSSSIERLADSGITGVLLILDEIDGITADPQFAHFIKGLIDANALSAKPLPLLLMLCGVEERRKEMIQRYQAIDRIFDVIEIEPMSAVETESFFEKAFSSVSITVTPDAMELFVEYSAGF